MTQPVFVVRLRDTIAGPLVPWWARSINVQDQAEAVFDDDRKLYLVRYTVFRTRRHRLYVHILVQGDAGRDQHMHPWLFVTVPLARGYDELRQKSVVRVRPFWPRLRTRSVFHRVVGIEPGRPAVTLVWAFVSDRAETAWGFDVAGELVPSRAYGALGTKVHFPADGAPTL